MKPTIPPVDPWPDEVQGAVVAALIAVLREKAARAKAEQELERESA